MAAEGGGGVVEAWVEPAEEVLGEGVREGGDEVVVLIEGDGGEGLKVEEGSGSLPLLAAGQHAWQLEDGEGSITGTGGVAKEQERRVHGAGWSWGRLEVRYGWLRPDPAGSRWRS